jgi:hypothetical protein
MAQRHHDVNDMAAKTVRAPISTPGEPQRYSSAEIMLCLSAGTAPRMSLLEG